MTALEETRTSAGDASLNGGVGERRPWRTWRTQGELHLFVFILREMTSFRIVRQVIFGGIG